MKIKEKRNKEIIIKNIIDNNKCFLVSAIGSFCYISDRKNDFINLGLTVREIIPNHEDINIMKCEYEYQKDRKVLYLIDEI